MIRGTGVLATIGATAPFVGLFGTVWGIMNSFIGISKSHTTNLAVVAPGIAEALLATALGLVAAIPAVVIYNHVLALDRRLSRAASPMPRPRCCGSSAAISIAAPSISVRRIAGARRPSRRHERASRPRRRRARRAARDQRHAVHRRDAGAADHLHDRGAAGDGGHRGRPAGLERRAQPRPDKPLFLTLKADLTRVARQRHDRPRARSARALDRATGGDKQQRIFLRADKTVPYGELMALMNVLRGAGYLKVALVGLEADKM